MAVLFLESRILRGSNQSWRQCSLVLRLSQFYSLFQFKQVSIQHILNTEKSAGKQSKLLNVLLSFAVGGLLGDVFLHLLPHSAPPHETHDESTPHDHAGEMHVGLWVLAGIITFLIVEKVVRSSHNSSGHSHSHSHSHEDVPTSQSQPSSSEHSGSTLRQRKPVSNENKTSQMEPSNKPDNHVQEPIAVSGWLNLVADFSHNFTDGLAIGASFLAGEKLGYITTIAILFHEIPHEIGDFAILVQSGFSKKNAILAQFSTALGAVLGTVIGLLAEGIGETTLWILPFTAGGFIYIATVTVIPILLEDTSFRQSLKEILALCFGVALMYLVALYE